MKKSILLALVSVAGFGSMAAENTPKPPKSPDKNVPIPIVVRKSTPLPKKYAPSRGEVIYVVVTDNGLQFSLADYDYPLTIGLEKLSEPYGYWTMSTSESSPELECEVTTGEYKITIVDSELVEYNGYFVIE